MIEYVWIIEIIVIRRIGSTICMKLHAIIGIHEDLDTNSFVRSVHAAC